MRDAARVVEHRVRERVRLRAGNRGIVTRGRGPVRATATFEPDALLGILLGIRSLDRELRRGIVSVRPRDSEARAVIARAFPPRSFHIQDAW